MAKNLNSVSFTVLLIVLVMASTGFLKSEADLCGDLTTCPPMTFLGEGGDHAPCTDNNAACCDCCIAKFGSSNMCWAVVEGSDQHCHCYTKEMNQCNRIGYEELPICLTGSH